MFNRLEWNQKLVPTPLNREFVLDKVNQNLFGYICFNSPTVDSQLAMNSNLKKAQSYCFELDSESEVSLDVKSKSNYLVCTQTSEWITKSGKFTVPKFSAVGIKHRGKVSLDFASDVGFLVYQQEHAFYGAQEPETVSFETDTWIAVENIDDRELTFEVTLL